MRIRLAVAVAALLASLGLASPALAAPDFQITIAPASQNLPPGSSVSFTIGIGGIDAFAAPVSLSVGGLPAGVTGSFSVDPVSPSGTSFLRLTAAETAQTGTFSLTVTGTGGGITHTATGIVTVDFGLIPICYGAVEGVITDAETHQPLPGVKVVYSSSNFTTTDDQGRYRLETIYLGPNNSPQEFGVHAIKTAPEYWDELPSGIAVCDETTHLDIVMTRVVPARVSGRVVEGTPDPSDYSHVIPTDTPVQGVTVWPYLLDAPQQVTGPDGLYDITFKLGRHNEPLDPLLYAWTEGSWREGYWDRFIPIGHVEAGQHVVQEIALVKKCTGSISGRVTYGDSGLPAAGVRVVTGNFLDGDEVTADADGRFSFPALLLGRNNAPTRYFVDSQPAGYKEANVEAPLDACGDHRDVTLVLEPQPVFYGAIEGHVYDEETGAPVVGADVSLTATCPCATTDASGHYRLERVFVGVDADDVGQTGVLAARDDHWPASVSPVEVHANATTTLDLRLLLRRYGGVTGVVRDSITGRVIPDANVSVGILGDFTDADGRYVVEGISLNDRNAPRDARVDARATGYWPNHENVEVRADETSAQDFDLLPICTDATITGTVVNAQTQQPIEGAVVVGGGALDYTDVNGAYTLTHVQVGTDNQPLQVLLQASALGFYEQTKRITVFCGGVIVVDFGRPPGTGAIEGHVTNRVTGQPIGNAFVGSEFGDATRTGPDGYYKFEHVPLGANGADRAWKVTADPDDFDAQTKFVTVRADQTSRLDFEFGEVVPRPPDAVDDSLTIAEDTAGSVNVLTNDTDPDGDTLTVTGSTNGAHGGVSCAAGGSCTYTPAANYNGPDSFTYTISDGHNGTDTATVNVAVTPVNDPPDAVDDSLTTPEDNAGSVNVLGNDTDPDGDGLTVTGKTNGAHGTANCTAAGACTYTPAANYNGPDSFTYTISDGHGGTDTATVNVTISPVNDPPDAADDTLTTSADTPGSVGVLANDTDPEHDPLVVTGTTNGAHGTAGCTTAGACTYTPAASYSGPDSFTYTISDGHGGTDTATVAVLVTAVVDVTPPTCTIVDQGKNASGKAFIRFRVQDGGSGLARYEVVYLRNASVLVDPFTVGTKAPVFVTATALTKSSLGVTLDFFDTAGNRATCDPIAVIVSREDDQPEDQTFGGVAQAERYVTIQNGNPGMRKVKLTVNGVKFKEQDLLPGEVRTFDISTALRPGNKNTITVSARGKKGASALVIISDMPPGG